MISIDFAKKRAEKSRDAQALLTAATPSWTWDQKTGLQWNTDITTLDQLIQTEGTKRTLWRNAAEEWQGTVNGLQAFTRQVASLGLVRFRKNPTKKARFAALHTDGESRQDIYTQACLARDAWAVTDPTWEITISLTLSALGSLLATNLALETAHGTAYTGWRNAETILTNKATDLDLDNVAWYAEATRRFPEGTNGGDLIRTTVPTTYRPEQPVGQAVISNLMAVNGEIHLDCTAPHATKFTYLHLAPGATAFVVVLADSPDEFLTLHNQPPGLHKFKAIGRNSRGEGPDSAIVEIAVSVAQVA